MRSRYAAFALGKTQYLSDTWHPSTRPHRLSPTPGETWIQLQLHAAVTEGDSATVEFTARALVGGRSHVLREVSRFVRSDGRWWYVDGT
jgi:SEC-C motif-containing protein